MEISDLLAETITAGASDLFLSVDAPPLIKVGGKLRSVREARLGTEENQRLIYSILSDQNLSEFEQHQELNISLEIPKVGRFRVNVFRQKSEPALVARYIKSEIPDFEALGLPPELETFVLERSGLVLVVGGTGSGKSTTLASMIDCRNRRDAGHILTVEDPIEFIHRSKKSLVNQREVGIDTASFESALQNVLREAPDVILIGEVRDRETMKHALNYAETGHLCLATLHATNATQALQRIINFFPEDAQRQLFLDLSLNLRAVVAQRLCVGRKGGRVPAVEVMTNTSYISDLIEKGKFEEVPEAMRRSSGRACRTFDAALYELLVAGAISEDEALRNADSRNNLSLRIRLEGTGSANSYPIKTEFVLGKLAPFDHYASYKVTPVRVDGRQPDAAGAIAGGISCAMDQKGLQENNDDPDLDIQFVFGIKSAKGLELVPVADEGQAVEHYAPQSEEHAMLIISVVDRNTDRPVYRLSASRRRPDVEESEVVMNQHFVEMLSSLPVGSDARRS